MQHPSNCIFAASSSCVQFCWYRNLPTFPPIRFPFLRLPISKLNIPIPVRPQRLSGGSPVLRILACSRKRRYSRHCEQEAKALDEQRTLSVYAENPGVRPSFGKSSSARFTFSRCISSIAWGTVCTGSPSALHSETRRTFFWPVNGSSTVSCA